MVANKSFFIKYGAILTLLADASLIVRKGIIRPYTVQPFEFLIILALISFLIGIYHSPLKTEFVVLFKKYSWPYLIILVLLLIGTVCGRAAYPFTGDIALSTSKDLFFFTAAYIGFILHVYYGKEYDFRKKVVWAMCLSIVFSFFIIAPSLANHLSLIGNGDSLMGLQGNQNLFSSFLLIPFSYFLLLLLKEKSFGRKIFYLVVTILSSALLLWTGSRGSWIAAIVITILFGLVHVLKEYATPLIISTKIIIIAIMAIVSLSCAYIILPHDTKIMILDRFFPSITGSTINPILIHNTSLEEAIKISETSGGSLPYQNRQNIWPEALSLFIHHPFGLGSEYARSSQALHEADGRWTLSHNSFLQAALSGGILLFILFIIVLIYILRIFIISNDTENLLYAGMFIGIFITMQFNDFLFVLPWMWILVGTIVAKRK